MSSRENQLIRTTYFPVFNWLNLKCVGDESYQEWQAHSLLICMLSTSVLMWAYVALAATSINSNFPLIVGIIVSLAHFCSPWILKKTGSITIAANLLIGAGMIHQGVFALFSGGFMSPILIWFGILPILGGILNRGRGVRTWALLTLIISGLILLLHSLDLLPADQISQNGEIIGQGLLVFGWIFLSTVIILTFIIFRDSNDEIIANKSEQIHALIRILCHDIGNPLTNISGRIELIKRRSNLDTVSQNHMTKIATSARRIVAIITQVQKWQAMESGKLDISVKPVELIKIVYDLLDQFEGSLTDKSIRVISNFTRDSTQIVWANEDLLFSQILSNIMSNAIKFSPQGGSLEINVKEKSGFAVLSIKDYGDGIPAELMAKLFSMTKMTTRRGTAGETGTGFGLPIVKSSIEAIDCFIEVESQLKEPGVETSWTCFSLLLRTEEKQ